MTLITVIDHHTMTSKRLQFLINFRNTVIVLHQISSRVEQVMYVGVVLQLRVPLQSMQFVRIPK